MEFIRSLEEHYSGIGKKIKRWAIWIFVIEAIVTIIAGLYGCFVFVSQGGPDSDPIVYLGEFLCLLAIPIIILIEFVGTWLLYAFGDMADNLQIVAKKLDPEAFKSEKVSRGGARGGVKRNKNTSYYCPSCKRKIYYGDSECAECGQKLDWS